MTTQQQDRTKDAADACRLETVALPHHETAKNIGKHADTWTRPAYPNAPHTISELLVHAEHISLADSLAGWRLVQDLVLGTAEGVSQPGDILLGHMQPLLDLTEAELLICTISQCSAGTAKETAWMGTTQKKPAGRPDCGP